MNATTTRAVISNSPELKARHAQKMFKLLEDKVISLVGPANYMTGAGFGQEIDESDVVIRLNRGFETYKKHPDDLGTRTDILYSCLIEKQANAGKINIQRIVEDSIKMVCAPPWSDYSGQTYWSPSGDPQNPPYPMKNCFHELVNPDTLVKMGDAGIPIRVIPSDINELVRQKILCKPNTGFLSIFDLLSFRPKLLKIYGFSFYLDGFISGEKLGIEEEQNCSEDEFADKAFSSKRHIQENMWSISKQVLLNFPQVQLDPQLTKILNMETFSKEVYRDLK